MNNALSEKDGQKVLLSDLLKTRQANISNRVIRAEQALRQLLASNAELASLSLNTRLQKLTVVLTVLSLLIAAIAAWAAIEALNRAAPAPRGNTGHSARRAKTVASAHVGYGDLSEMA